VAHPYNGHKENAVGHRRAKLLMRGGAAVAKRATGGKAMAVADEPESASCQEPDADDMPVAEGRKAGGRLDKKARGGKVEKFANGGATGGFHKITPSKRKPHVMININNGPRPPIKPAIPLPGLAAGMPSIRPPGMATGGRAKMRTGKTAGQGSGEGRLDEFRHMRGK